MSATLDAAVHHEKNYLENVNYTKNQTRFVDHITNRDSRKSKSGAMSCKRDKQHSCIVKTKAEQKNGHGNELKIMNGCMVESHESTRQSRRIFAIQNT